MALLEVSGLTRSFYGVQAVRGAAFAVGAGTITALIGPNGAGKTTTFQCISGVIAPDGGTIRFAGQDITGWPADRITRAGLTRSFQIARGISRLSVLDNLMLYAPDQPGEGVLAALAGGGAAREAAIHDRAISIARRLNLLAVANNPAGALSGGQKKLLELGRALMAEPKLIMLDEPIAGVNPALAETIAAHIAGLRDDGMSFLIIEHHMDLIAKLCDPVIVMAEGRVLAEGSFAAIAENPAVREAYLGAKR